MRDPKLIIDGSFCEGDFIDGLDVVAEVQFNAADTERCRFFPAECPVLNRDGPYCIPKSGQEVARFVVKLKTSLDDELRDFTAQAPMPARGYFDPTRENPDQSLTDKEEVTRQVGDWARKILGIQEVDSATVNQEYSAKPSESLLAANPVLRDSLFDSESSEWVHSCGTKITVAEVRRSVHHRSLPLAGTGEVITEHKPYCSHCEKKPNEYGPPVYADDLEGAEDEILRRMRKAN
jgi:hypothetical protein